jgi:glycosyltransferase involved in cell wall biosynthesis
VIHLSNALLIGLAKRIREKLKVIVVCSLQDEDVWVNAMDDLFRERTWKLMSERARDIDAFFSVSEFYAQRMKTLMNIPDNKLYTRHICVDPEDYSYVNSVGKVPVIGFISRMSRENGLQILIDAFILLKQEEDMKSTKLMITGGSTGDDDKFIQEIRDKIKNAGIQHDVIFQKDFEDEARHDFFRKVSVISVPVIEGEAFGMYLIESMASGVPVVQPALGAFPEIVSLAGGGIIYEKNTPEELSVNLLKLLRDPDQLKRLSEDGRKGVEQHFNIHSQASGMMNLYAEIIQRKNNGVHAVKD